MTNLIKCPHCQKEIELSAALTHEIGEEIKIQTEKDLRSKIESELELKIKNSENEAKELKDKNKKLLGDQLELEKINRALKSKDQERDFRTQKIILEVQEKTRLETLKQAGEDHRLKETEMFKKLQDALKTNEELRRKLEQGSEQSQGEVLEIDLENSLKKTFPHDEIAPVEKGVRGADVRQIVKTQRGTICGVILWESKRTKHWSDGWITKLKDDLRREKANIPALISQVLPSNTGSGIELVNGVWVCSYNLYLSLATLLRKNLIEVAFQKAVKVSSAKKADILYNYVTSHEFIQQVEALTETFKEMHDQIYKERTALEKSLRQREMQLRRMVESTINIYGDMRGIAGSSMPQITGLEVDLLESEN